MSIFTSLKDSLAKTRNGLLGALAAVAGKRSLSAAELGALEEQLLLADVGVTATEQLISAVKNTKADGAAIDSLRQEMLSILSPKGDIQNNKSENGVKPQVWLIAGVNGSGKTTSIGKLGHRLRAEGKAVLLAAADTYRAAANDQLKLWAERTGAGFIGSKPGADPASVAFDAVAAAQSRGADLLLIDTAGRLHTQRHLRDELAKVVDAIGKKLPGAPHLRLLVLDATSGQNGLSQVKLFSQAMRIDGIILTKLDGTAKGGIVLAIAQELGIPVLYVGTGEGRDDLRPFDAEEFVNGLLA